LKKGEYMSYEVIVAAASLLGLIAASSILYFGHRQDRINAAYAASVNAQEAKERFWRWEVKTNRDNPLELSQLGLQIRLVSNTYYWVRVGQSGVIKEVFFPAPLSHLGMMSYRQQGFVAPILVDFGLLGVQQKVRGRLKSAA
jgi:hypothetical protein